MIYFHRKSYDLHKVRLPSALLLNFPRSGKNFLKSDLFPPEKLRFAQSAASVRFTIKFSAKRKKFFEKYEQYLLRRPESNMASPRL
nr:MAG TPA: hypothetical protein [Microviridae sp.]